MTGYRWDRVLRRTLSTILEPFGFQKSVPICFVRKTPDCIQILNFGGRVQTGIFKFTCTVGLRFPELESRLHPDNDDESCATVFTPVHLLYESRKYFEWEVADPGELEVVAIKAVREILAVATPFFNRFMNLDNVEQALKGADAFRTFCLSPHQRTGVLATIALCKGHSDDARAIISDAKADSKNETAASLRRIDEIAQRLFPSSTT